MTRSPQTLFALAVVAQTVAAVVALATHGVIIDFVALAVMVAALALQLHLRRRL